ncbi:MAG TPA: hypothetical protein VKB38_20610 [Terracidiphilus sp.]|nr:hypothetical protein [Terracidiphilus sp.]
MNRPILTCAFAVFACLALSAQQSSQSDPYAGQSHPPSDDTIMVPAPTAQAKPRAGKPLVQAPPTAPAQQDDSATVPVPSTPAPPSASAAQPSSVDPNANFPEPNATGTDSGTVQVAPAQANSTTAGAQPGLSTRDDDGASDPDGDIVHPHPDGPGVLGAGASIRVKLLTLLSTADSQRGEEFRTQVDLDVVQDGQVLIPAGAEIDGKVVDVSSGTTGGHGTMRLRPETVILQDGTRYHLDAQVTGTLGANARVSGEGVINAAPRYKKAGIEYGAAVGGGAATGALIGGPVGALTGGLIGAGAITVHLLVNHAQAVLEPGTILVFTLNDRLNLKSEPSPGD